jgi:hypothetical protein
MFGVSDVYEEVIDASDFLVAIPEQLGKFSVAFVTKTRAICVCNI